MSQSESQTYLRNKNYDRQRRNERMRFRNEHGSNGWSDPDGLRSPLRTRGHSSSFKKYDDRTPTRSCQYKKWESNHSNTLPAPTWTLSLDDFPCLNLAKPAELPDANVTPKEKVPVKKDWYAMVEEEEENCNQYDISSNSTDNPDENRLPISEVTPKRNWAEIVLYNKSLEEENGSMGTPRLFTTEGMRKDQRNCSEAVSYNTPLQEENGSTGTPRAKRCVELSRASSVSSTDQENSRQKTKPKVEYETSAEILCRRQKQIDYGKNTLEYSRYARAIPRFTRKLEDPRTPPKHVKCSRRSWDSQVRIWRLKLHKWDPPSATENDSCKSVDIGLSDMFLDAPIEASFPMKRLSKPSSLGSSSDSRAGSVASCESGIQEINFNDEEEDVIEFL